jgi:hypothetical protein
MIPPLAWLAVGLVISAVLMGLAFRTNGDLWAVGGFMTGSLVAAGLGLLAFVVALLS